MTENKKFFVTKRDALKYAGTFAGSSAILSGVASAQEQEDDDEKKSEEQKKEEKKSDRAFAKSLREHHEKAINQGASVEDGASTQDVPGPTTVNLGQDVNLSPNYGDVYESDDADSLQDAALMGEYSASADTIEARAFDQAGYGTFEAWSYLAHEFTVEGSGSQTATVTINPYVIASMGYTGSGSNSASLELIVENLDGQEKWSETVFSHGGYIKDWSQSYT